MRCRECGLELDERDRLRNGAYQCPECGTIHHTASSSKASPSPWRNQRGRRSASAADVLQKRLWVLPLWIWAAIILVILIAAILLIALGGNKADPGTPAAQDTPVTEAQNYPEIVASDDDADDGIDAGIDSGAEVENVAETPQPATQAVETAGHTGITVNDFLVSFNWAIGQLNYTSSLSAPTEGTNSNGEQTLSYDFEDWFHVVLTVDTDSSAIRHAVATSSAEVSKADNQKMLSGFVTVMYCFDTSLSGKKALRELNAMIADNMLTYGTSSIVA